jgi:hypothetical protein
MCALSLGIDVPDCDTRKDTADESEAEACLVIPKLSSDNVENETVENEIDHDVLFQAHLLE